MSDGRAKRQIKKSRKYEAYDEERLHAASPKKYVLRPLETKDVRELLGEEVYLLWPDDGLWYPADVKKVDVKAKQADVIYTTTDEEETIDLEELMKDRCIALREARRQSYELGPDEVLDTEERPQASRSFARSGDGGSEASSGNEQDSKLEASDSYDDEDGDDGGRKHSNSAKRRRGA